MFTTNAHGWVSCQPTQEMIEEARLMLEEGDRRYAQNLYIEQVTDERWIGFLGEVVFRDWLDSQPNRIDYQWLAHEGGAGHTDFYVNRYAVGVKTVKRKVPMLIDYSAQVSARHAQEPSDDYFFMCYEYRINWMRLLGGIRREAFLEQAVFYGPGDYVHQNYQIREGHAIYNLEPVSRLERPAAWLSRLVREH